ncbi:MAG: BTAD domain-containing putative transcriptional regulator [Actinomycetota bacterium]
MEFRILGPLEVVDGERRIALGGRKRRALLTALLLHRGEVVSVDELVAVLWGDEPPKTAEHSIQVYVSELRKAIGSGGGIGVAYRDPGYTLDVPETALDVHRFDALRERGRAALPEDPARAAALLGEALDVWRGAALADFRYDDFAQGDIERLEERRLATIEDRVDAELALGRHADLVAELHPLVDGHPDRDRLRAALMLALYRSGRQAEALETFHEARARLGEELGLDPGPELAELASRILAADPALDLAVAPREAGVGSVAEPVPDTSVGQPTRKFVSVVAVDIGLRAADGSAADPEATEQLLPRVADQLRPTLASHGASSIPSDGAEIVGVFGHPRVHEDDPIRAVRAADEVARSRDTLRVHAGVPDAIDLLIGVGVSTGATLSTDRPADIARDIVRDARRLAANGAGVFVDPATLAAVRDAVDGGPLAEDPDTFRVDRIARGERGVARRMDSPIVGRDDELTELARAYGQVRDGQGCRLVTVSGDAGIGKTRLADEFVRRIAADARVLIGRCLSYGEGITYWPIAEAIRAEAGIHDDDDPDDVRRALLPLVPASPDRERIVDGIADILGVGDARLTEGEALWSVRRFFDGLASTGTVVLLIEDVHWAEPTLLDLLERLIDWMRDAPLLVVCTTRPEIFERPTGWGGRPEATTVTLRPLSRADVDRLIENLVRDPTLDAGAKGRIAAAAEGNPLFVEQLLAMLMDEGLLHQDGGAWSLAADLSTVSLPTSVHALLNARLDRLSPDGRGLLGIASVIGRTFDIETLAGLADDDPATVAPIVHELVRKDLVRPERTPEGDSFRFRHVLIMQAAYEMVPKSRRAELHEEVAEQLAATAGERSAGYDEIIGDHLARAAGAYADIGGDPVRVEALRTRAGTRLAAGAARASARGDMPAAATLYGSAIELLAHDDPDRLPLLPELGNALIEIGRLEDAGRVFDEAIERGTELGELGVVADALLFRFEAEAFSGRDVDARRSIERAKQLIPVAEAAGNEIAQQRAWSILGIWGETYADQRGFTERAFSLADRAGDTKGLHENIQMLCGLLVMGPGTVEEGIAVVADFHRRTEGDRVMEAAIGVNAEAQLLAMSGRIDEGRRVYERARATFRELGLSLWLGASGTVGPTTAELTGGDPRLAEALLLEGIEILERISPNGHWLIEDLRLLVQAQVEQEHATEAAATLERLRAMHAVDEPWFQFWPGEVLRAEGRFDEAADVLRSTFDSVQQDWVLSRSLIAFSLARALRSAGREEEALDAGRTALAIVERKGDIASTAKVRAFLEA